MNLRNYQYFVGKPGGMELQMIFRFWLRCFAEIKTLIIIAYRLTTIKTCDKIYETKNGMAIEKKFF